MISCSSIITALVLGLPLVSFVVGAADISLILPTPSLPRPPAGGQTTQTTGAGPSTTTSELGTTTTTSDLKTTTSSNPTSSQNITTTQTIDVSSFMTTGSASSSLKQVESPTSTDMPSETASVASDSSSVNHRNLIIILSTVLGFTGLALIGSALFLLYRWKKGRAPFGHHRGASPIGDDEIASWRRHAQEQKIPPPTPDSPRAPHHLKPIPLAYSPGWAWTASPTSIRTVSVATMPGSPAFIARAPNARAGLTDETVPGADPFIAPIKRQSSRLSKQQPGHSREKSRKSSMSGKSSWSIDRDRQNRAFIDVKEKEREQERKSTWYDPETKEEAVTPISPRSPRITTWYNPEDEAVNEALKDIENGSSTPGTSIFNELEMTGGLSPRPEPKSRQHGWGDERNQIGRAIG